MAVLINFQSKKIFIILFVVILVLGYFFFNDRSGPITNLKSSGTTIVAFGDSLVRGVGASEGNDFISLLSARVGEPIINLGVSGNTTEAALQRLDTLWEHDPKIVIVLLGGNDYLRRVPIDQTFANLDTIIDDIHAHGSAVLLLGVRGGLLRDTYNDRFAEFAKQKEVGFVPNILDDIIGDDELMSDTIHPNDKGYKKVADKIAPVLTKMLGK
jgi:lysophospholipase L1-like esterase